MHLFYHPDNAGDILELDEQESRHAVRVLRLQAGDPVVVVDGHGGWYECRVEEPHPKRCRLWVNNRRSDPNPLAYRLHIGISPTRSMDRLEWFLEKATEIGITEITPLLCHRTVRGRLNRERLERILVSAMKQSLRATKPVLHEAVSLESFLRQPRPGTRGIAHCIEEDSGGLVVRTGIKDLLLDNSYTLLVGPEGDFTEEEVKSATEAGYVPFHLGPSRLRTETAGMVICAAVSLLAQG